MRRNLLIVAAVGGVFSQSAMAGFSLTATKGTVAGYTGDVYTIVCINDGITTGTQLKGCEFFYTGAPVAFEVEDTDDGAGNGPDGIPDTVKYTSATRTRIRASSTAANNVYVGITPTNGFAQPNPYVGGVTSFAGAIANTGTTQATGTGFQCARLFLPTGGTGVFHGNLGGDQGAKVPFSATLGISVPNTPPVITPIPDTDVVFGSIVSSGEPFSVTVDVTDVDAADFLALAAGPAPAGVTGLSVAGPTGVSPRQFTVSGVLNYSLNGSTVVIPITATDGTGNATTSNFRLIVTPEPTSISLIGLSSLLCARRR